MLKLRLKYKTEEGKQVLFSKKFEVTEVLLQLIALSEYGFVCIEGRCGFGI